MSKSTQPTATALTDRLLQSLLPWGVVVCVLLGLLLISVRGGDGLMTAMAGLGLLFGIGGLGYQGWLVWQIHRADLSQALQQMQLNLQRAKAVYKLSSTLSQTLNYASALQEAQLVGQFALRPQHRNVDLMAAVLLFRQEDNLLHVATARYLNHQDYAVTLPAEKGLLAQALQSDQPVFGQDGTRDPELRRFAAFQNARSLLAIPLRQGYESYGVLLFGAEVEDAFDRSATDALSAIGVQVSITLKNAVLYQGILDDKARIVSIDEQARKKLARDLHDGPTQTIALISSISSVIQRYLAQQDLARANQELEKVQQLAQKTVREIRHLLFSLRPLVLENKGLVAALHELSAKMEETYSQAVVVEADAQVESLLDEDDQGTIFYIVEEAVNNALKHAQASMIWVRLTHQGNHILVEIEDNGKGFNVQAVNTDYHQRGSLGMVNLRERSEMLGGDLNLLSEPGRGTLVRVMFPLPESQTTGRPATPPRIEAGQTRMASRGAIPDEAPRSSSSEESGWSDMALD